MNARRIIIPVGLVAIAAIALALWLYVRALQPQLELGVGYGARVACACRYIGNRPLASCYKDFEPGMEAIGLRDDPATKTVTASVPLIASRSVTFDPLLGCRPAPLKKPLAIITQAVINARSVSAIHPPPKTRSPA